MKPRLLDHAALERSSVVANNAMNRERGLSGVNSYARDLGFDPVALLTARLPDASWIDVCCGSGSALLEAESRFAAEHPADLVTCVHGLHYIGDKLALLTAMAGWLTPGGTLAAHVDPDGIRHRDTSSAARSVRAEFRRAGIEYDGRRHHVTARGPAALRFPATYLGADDTAVPGYTGQPAVASYYDW